MAAKIQDGRNEIHFFDISTSDGGNLPRIISIALLYFSNVNSKAKGQQRPPIDSILIYYYFWSMKGVNLSTYNEHKFLILKSDIIHKNFEFHECSV